MEQFRMAADQIGYVLNRDGHGSCPWCPVSGPMVVGEFGVLWPCGHARRLPPLHASEKTTRQCRLCSPEVAVHTAARGLLRLIAA